MMRKSRYLICSEAFLHTIPFNPVVDNGRNKTTLEIPSHVIDDTRVLVLPQ